MNESNNSYTLFVEKLLKKVEEEKTRGSFARHIADVSTYKNHEKIKPEDDTEILKQPLL